MQPPSASLPLPRWCQANHLRDGRGGGTPPPPPRSPSPKRSDAGLLASPRAGRRPGTAGPGDPTLTVTTAGKSAALVDPDSNVGGFSGSDVGSSECRPSCCGTQNAVELSRNPQPTSDSMWILRIHHVSILVLDLLGVCHMTNHETQHPNALSTPSSKPGI